MATEIQTKKDNLPAQMMDELLSNAGEGIDYAPDELAEALSQVNMDHLLESGIRLTSEIQSQVELLEKQGKHDNAVKLYKDNVIKLSKEFKIDFTYSKKLFNGGKITQLI